MVDLIVSKAQRHKDFPHLTFLAHRVLQELTVQKVIFFTSPLFSLYQSLLNSPRHPTELVPCALPTSSYTVTLPTLGYQTTTLRKKFLYSTMSSRQIQTRGQADEYEAGQESPQEAPQRPVNFRMGYGGKLFMSTQSRYTEQWVELHMPPYPLVGDAFVQHATAQREAARTHASLLAQNNMEEDIFGFTRFRRGPLTPSAPPEAVTYSDGPVSSIVAPTTPATSPLQPLYVEQSSRILKKGNADILTVPRRLTLSRTILGMRGRLFYTRSARVQLFRSQIRSLKKWLDVSTHCGKPPVLIPLQHPCRQESSDHPIWSSRSKGLLVGHAEIQNILATDSERRNAFLCRTI
jgi:hypothetical protein